MPSFEDEIVPFTITYRYRPVDYADQRIRTYLLTNGKESKLGTTLLLEPDLGGKGINILRTSPTANANLPIECLRRDRAYPALQFDSLSLGSCP
jgi:hypothetical protein